MDEYIYDLLDVEKELEGRGLKIYTKPTIINRIKKLKLYNRGLAHKVSNGFETQDGRTGTRWVLNFKGYQELIDDLSMKSIEEDLAIKEAQTQMIFSEDKKGRGVDKKKRVRRTKAQIEHDNKYDKIEVELEKELRAKVEGYSAIRGIDSNQFMVEAIKEKLNNELEKIKGLLA